MRILLAEEMKFVVGGDNPGHGAYGDTKGSKGNPTGGAFGRDGKDLRDGPSLSGSNGKDRCSPGGARTSSRDSGRRSGKIG
jgi:hypothetical protein